MSITKEIWANDIAENLFPDNSFMMAAVNDDAFVDGSKVHRATAGAKPSVSIDRSSLPATIAARTDTPSEYDLNEFTSDPTLITDIDEIETNYDKRQSVLFDHIETINQKIADQFGFLWAPTVTGNIIRTTGAAAAATASGATGTRLKLLKKDLLTAMVRMDQADIPREGRRVLLPAVFQGHLLEDSEINDADFSGRPGLPAGVVGMLFGFQVMIRSTASRYSNAGTPVPVAPSVAAATSDNLAALCWHPNFVTKALGSVKVYADEDKPEYYGSIFSAMCRAGGIKRYADGRGVVAIVEAHGA